MVDFSLKFFILNPKFYFDQIKNYLYLASLKKTENIFIKKNFFLLLLRIFFK